MQVVYRYSYGHEDIPGVTYIMYQHLDNHNKYTLTVCAETFLEIKGRITLLNRHLKLENEKYEFLKSDPLDKHIWTVDFVYTFGICHDGKYNEWFNFEYK